jgi:hypothetical protein
VSVTVSNATICFEGNLGRMNDRFAANVMRGESDLAKKVHKKARKALAMRAKTTPGGSVYTTTSG